MSDYIAGVFDLSIRCQLGDLRENMAIHVMLGEIKNESLVQEISSIPELNLNRFTTTCAGYEVAERTMTAFQGREVEEVSVLKVEEGRRRGCERKGQYLYECPVIDCYKCLEKGHLWQKTATNASIVEVGASKDIEHRTVMIERAGTRQKGIPGKWLQRGATNVVDTQEEHIREGQIGEGTTKKATTKGRKPSQLGMKKRGMSPL